MEQNTEKPLPGRFATAFNDVPPLPGHLYGVIVRKIDHSRLFSRSLWAAAAMFIIAVLSVTAFRMNTPAVSYSPEVAEELVSISSYYNDVDIADDDESIYEDVLYLP